MRDRPPPRFAGTWADLLNGPVTTKTCKTPSGAQDRGFVSVVGASGTLDPRPSPLRLCGGAGRTGAAGVAQRRSTVSRGREIGLVWLPGDFSRMAVAAAISFEPFGSTALKVPCSPGGPRRGRRGRASSRCERRARGRGTPERRVPDQVSLVATVSLDAVVPRALASRSRTAGRGSLMRAVSIIATDERATPACLARAS